MHGEVRFQRAVHAQHAEELFVGRRKRAQSHQCQRAGCAGASHEPCERRAGCRSGVDQPAATIEYRPFCVLQQFHRIAQPSAPQRFAPGFHHFFRHFSRRIESCQLDVLGKIEQYGPRPAARRHAECLAHQPRDLVGAADLRIPFRDRPRQAERVAFLECVSADRMGRDLAADANHRNGIADRIQQAGDGIADAGTGGDEHHTRFAGRARVTLRGMNRGLLMADEHMPNALFACSASYTGNTAPPG